MMKKIVQFLILCCPLFFCGCPDPEKQPEQPSSNSNITIYGIVSDADTNAPLQGVLITLMPGSVNRYTGSDGTYQFDNVDGSKMQYTLQTQIDGYHADRKTVNVKQGETSLQVNFVLHAE